MWVVGAFSERVFSQGYEGEDFLGATLRMAGDDAPVAVDDSPPVRRLPAHGVEFKSGRWTAVIPPGLSTRRIRHVSLARARLAMAFRAVAAGSTDDGLFSVGQA